MSSYLAMHGVQHLGLSAMHTSHAQLSRAPVSMHQADLLGQQSVINAIDGVGVGALRNKSAAPSTPAKMSAAVLAAAKMLAKELQELQEDFIAEQYSQNGAAPQNSSYMKSSWGQMSVLDSLMGQLHTEVKRETGDRATVEVKREAYTAKGYTGDWREVLQENKSTKSAESRRMSKWVQQDNAARLIQHAWRRYRLRCVIRSGMRKKWELHRKYVTQRMVKSVEDDMRERHKLTMRENVEAHKSGDFKPPASDPLAGWQATVPGLRSSWVEYNSQPRNAHPKAPSPGPSLPEVKHGKGSLPERSTPSVPFLPEIPSPAHNAPVPRTKKSGKPKKKVTTRGAPSPRTPRTKTAPPKAPSAANLQQTAPAPPSKASRPKTTPLPAINKPKPPEPKTIPRREPPRARALHAADNAEPAALPPEEEPQGATWRYSSTADVRHSTDGTTGLWRKTRTRFTAINLFPISTSTSASTSSEKKAGFFSAERSHGINPPRVPAMQRRTTVHKWQSAANRTQRVAGAWHKFQAFDQAVSAWVDHNKMLLEQQAEETDEEGDARGANPNASAAGSFLVVASTLHKLCRQSITAAATHVSRTSSMQRRDAAGGEEDLKLITLSSLAQNPKLLHHQLAAECVPVKVALGQVKPLVMLKRSLDRARNAQQGRRG
eukprot:jgi/Tetstr1/449222/TSEL_036428.t2